MPKRSDFLSEHARHVLFVWLAIVPWVLLLALALQGWGLLDGELVHVIADCHIYDRHVDIVKDLISREPQPAPMLISDESIQDFYQFTPDSFKLAGYAPLDFDAKIPIAV